MFRVLALDPGGTTGWATYTARVVVDPFTNAVEYKDEGWNCGQLAGEHHSELWKLLLDNQSHDYQLVCERFEYRNTARSGLVLDSREYIGVTKLFAQQRRLPLTLQNASEAKGFVRDSHLKRLALWSSGNPHAMDAMRHLLFWLTNRYEDKNFRKMLLERGWK